MRPDVAQLHSIVRDASVNVDLDDTQARELVGAERTSALGDTYGEMTLSFIPWLIAAMQIDSTSVFVDVGSGSGLVAIAVAALSGATVVGIELFDAFVILAQYNAAQIDAQLFIRRFEPLKIAFVHGNAALVPVPWPQGSQASASHVFINNFVIDDETVKLIIKSLLLSQKLLIGAKVLLLKPLLFPLVRGDEVDEVFRWLVLPPVLLETDINVANWTSSKFYPVLYTIRERQDDNNALKRERREYVQLLQSRPKNIGERN
jgi:SAM-dependent methyltransferase